MIGFLRGHVLRIRGKKIILEIGGVGYEVFVNAEISGIAQIGDEKKLWIFTHQTSDSTTFFGFANEENLEFFELLNSVNGVGPKTALEILETPAAKLREIISAGNAKKLGEIPGIGKKTAARIVLELRAKIGDGKIEIPRESEIDAEILDALASLGYSKKDARKILAQKPREIVKLDEIVKWFLRNA